MTTAIRAATLDDLPAITDIYNQAILRTTATFDTDPKTPDERRAWYNAHDARHPLLVAESVGVDRASRLVIGWASLSEWSDRAAYADTAEVSIYIREGNRGQGVGTALMHAISLAGETARLHTIIARVVAGNAASVQLHLTAGYVQIGVMREVGRKFGQLLDVILLQKMVTIDEGSR